MYLFNLSCFFTFLRNVEYFKFKKVSKYFYMYFFFIITGLPVSSIFFFKLKVIYSLFIKNNYALCVILFILLIISMYLYYSLMKKTLVNEDYSFLKKKKNVKTDLRFCLRLLYINIITNAYFIFFIISLFF